MTERARQPATAERDPPERPESGPSADPALVERASAPEPANRLTGPGGEAISVSAATAITHFGPECPSCSKVNHPGTIRCVFCGHMFVAVAPQGEWSDTPPAGELSSSAVAPRIELASTEPPPPGSDSSATLSGPVPPGEVRLQNADGSAPSHTVLATSQASSAMRRSTWSTPFDNLQLPVADPLIGVVVADRYRIVEGLGRGGMGIVYKVEHKQIGKLLAMKLLTGELSRNPEVVRRFKHEALTASRLSSPNTVQVFDFGVSDGLTYLVMELVAGEDLGRLLRANGPMPWSRLGKVIVQVCSSLAEAHAKGIVHRDIKPENIMLLRARDGSDVAKVLDFGLAKLREGEGLSELTSAGAIVGTPYFMSPEQVRGDPVDARADIYSLGALMYRALTGHYPFNGPTPMSVFTKHLTEMPAPPAERAPELGIPPGVSRIVMKCLLKNPADRFQRVEDLQSAVVDQLRALGTSSVDELLDSGAVRKLGAVPRPEAKGAEIATRDEVERYERKLRRQRYTAFAFVGVLLLGAAGAAVKLVQWQGRAPAFTGAEVEPNDVAGDANPVPIGATVSGHLGRRIDAAHGDRDFFAVDVPAPPGGGTVAFTRLRVSALPNIPMCTMLYRPGFSTALGQYCVGRPGRPLDIPSLRLPAGRYFVAVLQDMDPYGASAPPYVHENISDSYSMTLEASAAIPGFEAEPNDQVASASSIAVGESLTGMIGWARDEDVYCVRAAAGERAFFRVTDTARDPGTVLEATPMHGTEEGAPVRVHTTRAKAVTTTDVVEPWESAPEQTEPDVPRCVRIRLVTDPWASERDKSPPVGGPETYTVEVMSAR